MASEFRYKLTAKAEADLDEIVSYLTLQLENPQAAAGFLNTLLDAIQEACSFPESGSPVANEFLPYKGIRKKLVGNYVLYYSPNRDTETIYVLRVLFGRRNLDEILREMNFS